MAGSPYVISIHLLKINSNVSCTYKITIFSIRSTKYLYPLVCNIDFINISMKVPIRIKNENSVHAIIKSNIIFYLYFSAKEIELILKLKIGEFLTLNTLNPKDGGALFPTPPKETNYSSILFVTYYANIEKTKPLESLAI